MDPLLRIALRTAREAGRLLLPTYDRPPYSRMGKTAIQRFTSDLRKELLYLFEAQVQRAYPDHVVSGDPNLIPHSGAVHWLIEVLEGESNFLRSLSEFSVVVGIYENRVLMHGVIYQSIDDLEFYVTKDIGAQVNNTRLRVSSTKSLASSLISVSGPQVQLKPKDSLMSIIFEDLSQLEADIRMSGSPALNIARVAQGKLDANISVDLPSMIYDIGALLVNEAGGFVRRQALSGITVDVFSNSHLHVTLERNYLKRLGPILTHTSS